MYQEHKIMPLITQLKTLFNYEILDFAILSERGFRYTHTDILLENSFKVIHTANQLKENNKKYEIIDIDTYQTVVFYDHNEAFLAIIFEHPMTDETLLEAAHKRLLEVSFFMDHLATYLSQTQDQEYGMVIMQYDGEIRVFNRYAEKLFKQKLTHINEFEPIIKRYDAFIKVFEDVKNRSAGRMFRIDTLFNQRLLVNCMVDTHAEIVQFVFTHTPLASFYNNILNSFDYLRLGVVHFELIFDDFGDPKDARMLYGNEQYRKMMDVSISRMIGKTIYEIYPSFGHTRFMRYARVALTGKSASYEDYIKSYDKYFHVYSYAPAPNEFVNVYFETTQFHKMQTESKAQLKKIQMMMTLADMGFLEIDFKHKTLESDEYVHKIFETDYLDYDTYRKTFIDIVHTDDRKRVFAENARLMTGEIKEGSSIFRVVFPNGKTKYLEYYLQTLTTDDQGVPEMILGLIRDITEQQETRKKIEFMANHDSLTKLYNRHHFNERIKHHKYTYPLKLALFDLDGLKAINDIFGHYQGDEVIRTFANLLKEIYTDTTISRVGGDEFVIIFENGTDAIEKREKVLRKKLEEVLFFNLPVEVSIGYADVLESSYNFKEALRLAEEKMYREKLYERPRRKKRTLRILMDYLHREDKTLKARIARLKKLAVPLMKVLGYSRRDERENMDHVIDYHAIGRIMDFVESDGQDMAKSISAPVHEYLHVESGYKILSNLFEIEIVKRAVLHQCEHVDGSGYPHKLKGKEIPYYARIMAVVYRYDTLVNNHKKHSVKEALKMLDADKGQVYDPKIVDAFKAIIQET